MIKVLSWNLNHRIREKAIPDTVIEVFRAVAPDLILLNEFVDGPSRAPFRDSLRAGGWVHQEVSDTPAQHNQVYAAARIPFDSGGIEPPQFDGSAMSNFLHIRFCDLPIEIVGIRVPAYERASERKAYWTELLATMRKVEDRTIAFVGDFNRDPFRKAHQPDVPTLRFPGAEAYEVPNPVGPWSYISMSGSSTSRIDHVVYTGALSVTDAAYVAKLGNLLLAGPHDSQPISDHAALTFTLKLSEEQDAGA